MESIKRLTSIKCDIRSIKEGEYVVKEGWIPNFIKTVYGEINRANIIGIVVSIINEKEFVIDDGTDNILVRSFDKSFPVNIGETVLIIGRPRQYETIKYIFPEIVKRVSKEWLKFRKRELEFLKKEGIIIPKINSPLEEKSSENRVNIYEKIISLIKSLDNGEGVYKSEIILNCGENSEEHLNHLVEEGELYEISPGKYKVLE